MTQTTFSPNGHKRAVLYARVSTDEQADKGYSLGTQTDACRKYAEQHGFTSVAEITDDYTGTKLDRPGLDQVRALIDRQEIDAVIVLASDRLSRKLAHVLVLREEFQRAGIELHFVNRGKSEDTPESRMTENIEGVFNEYWREKILESSRRGMNGKAELGKVVGTGLAPYGYAHSGDGHFTFTIVESEAKVVRLIFQWYIYGEGETGPMTLYAVAKRLSESKTPTPGESRNRPRKRAPGMWSECTVHDMLRSEVYAGMWRFGKRIGGAGKGGRRAIGDTFPVNVPAIVDRGTWDAAQERIEHNKAMSKRNGKREYLLRGFIRCGDCNKPMGGFPKTGTDVYYYRCTSRVHKFPDLEKSQCTNRQYYRGDLLDYLAWDRYVIEGMSDADTFRQGLTDTQEMMQREAKPRQTELEATEAQISKTEAEARNLADEIKTVKKGGLMYRTLKEKETEIDHQYTDLCKHRDRLLAELKAKTMTNDEIDNAMLTRERIIRGLQNPTFEMKRAFLDFIRVEVAIKDGKAEVKGNMPVKLRVFDLAIESCAMY